MRTLDELEDRLGDAQGVAENSDISDIPDARSPRSQPVAQRYEDGLGHEKAVGVQCLGGPSGQQGHWSPVGAGGEHVDEVGVQAAGLETAGGVCGEQP
ncbi:MAG TPA: hypothetical protein VII98_13860, partial [Solirubrobacteraceae bacterium]